MTGLCIDARLQLEFRLTVEESKKGQVWRTVPVGRHPWAEV